MQCCETCLDPAWISPGGRVCLDAGTGSAGESHGRTMARGLRGLEGIGGDWRGMEGNGDSAMADQHDAGRRRATRPRRDPLTHSTPTLAARRIGP